MALDIVFPFDFAPALQGMSCSCIENRVLFFKDSRDHHEAEEGNEELMVSCWQPWLLQDDEGWTDTGGPCAETPSESHSSRGSTEQSSWDCSCLGIVLEAPFSIKVSPIPGPRLTPGSRIFLGSSQGRYARSQGLPARCWLELRRVGG